MGGPSSNKYPPLLIDPAIEKWYFMKENTHAYFKFTPRTIRISVALALVVPGAAYFVSTYFRVSVSGKKKICSKHIAYSKINDLIFLFCINNYYYFNGLEN